MESPADDYRIQSFDLDTQMLLKTALKDPSSVNLEKVSNVIVDQSLKDQLFSKEAGRICYTIVQLTPEQQEALNPAYLHRCVSQHFVHAVPSHLGPPVQAETQQNNGNVFRRSVLNRLQQEYKRREETRGRSRQEWMCYVSFICNVFNYLKVNNMPMVALVHPVYDCLIRLAQPDALMNEEEVDCLVVQLHRIGEQLEKVNAPRMDELFFLLRDGFLLQEGLTSMARLLLLEILEFRAGGWSLSGTAHKYYYSEIAD
uniref:MIF4G domain containing n=1 Tax=Gasterosteus aculeatus aculeatus TaxID=481459 RepID=G3PF35_GASAC